MTYRKIFSQNVHLTTIICECFLVELYRKIFSPKRSLNGHNLWVLPSGTLSYMIELCGAHQLGNPNLEWTGKQYGLTEPIFRFIQSSLPGKKFHTQMVLLSLLNIKEQVPWAIWPLKFVFIIERSHFFRGKIDFKINSFHYSAICFIIRCRYNISLAIHIQNNKN